MTSPVISSWSHRLSFVLRFRHHFLRNVIGDELPLRLAPSSIRPVATRRGDIRQPDGSYRFIDVPRGTHEVRWRAPFTREEAGWTRFEQIEVTVPHAAPQTVIELDLWPSARAAVPGGMTAVRGRLIGTRTSGLEVRIGAPAGSPPAWLTRTDSIGEFVFFLPGPFARNGRDRFDLQIWVAGRTVAGGASVPPGELPAFGGDQFEVAPGRVSRIGFRVT